jgi:hypothetical protein
MADQKEATGSTNCTTPEFRISYPSVFKPKLNTLSKKMEYSVEALFPKGADLTKLKAAAKAAATKKWGPDEKKWPKFTNNPFKNQADKIADLKAKEKSTDGLVEGAFHMNFKCLADKSKPKVVDQNLQEIIEESKFYAGGWAKASVNAFAYEQGKNCGISFGLNALQFTRDGEPFSGRPSVEQAFEAIAGADEETKGDGSSLSMFS